MNRKQKKMLRRILASAALLLVLSLCEPEGWLRLLYLLPYLLVGWDILRSAVKGIGHGQFMDENFLMAVATIGAIALGEFTEAVAVMLFYQIGELFQSCAVGRSRRNIAALMDIRPDCAYMEQEGELVEVDPDEVAVGSEILVRPGERIPIDGVVLDGRSSVDTAALTGESLPRELGPGDEAVSGCINLSGVLRIRTTRPFGESTVAKILDLVENASSRKSRSEAFISRFARWYTPAVCYGALALALLPPVVQLLLGQSADWGGWLYRALTFLVISCPCALVVSIPLSFFAGLGGVSRQGVLIKGSNYLEALSQVRCVVFDKTGTVTEGRFAVQGVYSAQDEAKLLEYAAHAECYSAHPVSESIRAAFPGELDRERVRAVVEHSGRGVSAVVDGVAVAAGNEKLMAELGIAAPHCEGIGTVVHVALDGEYAGHILVADAVKPNAKAAMAALRKSGVRRLVMLTGDVESVAAAVSGELGIREYRASLLPQDKVAAVEELLADMRGGKLAFVGDGINDAPVLSRSDVGIAMGAMGSDAAIEAADVVLMDDDPARIALAMATARRCMRIVYENIVFAIGIKFLCLVLGALGLAGMWLAIFADVGVMVLAVLNAMRAMIVRKE
ncbi:MAG: cadmium-translocating P-type ATPase [Oscillospiraceae bacterium]|nr:cadmium-translocating P-type ATPase [Oscillospiraceae bacterium]